MTNDELRSLLNPIEDAKEKKLLRKISGIRRRLKRLEDEFKEASSQLWAGGSPEAPRDDPFDYSWGEPHDSWILQGNTNVLHSWFRRPGSTTKACRYWDSVTAAIGRPPNILFYGGPGVLAQFNRGPRHNPLYLEPDRDNPEGPWKMFPIRRFPPEES